MASVHHVERARQEGVLFGIPLGDLGIFQTLIIGLGLGFGAFFLATFLAILGFAIYAGVSHHSVDFAMTYKRVGLPVGLLVGVVALGFLGVQWVRRLLRRER